MRELIYYILAAIGGGIASQINEKKHSHNPDIKKFFKRGFTSVVIGVVFGLTFKEITGNVNITIAITALAGVMGMPSLEWLINAFKEKATDNLKLKNNKNGN